MRKSSFRKDLLALLDKAVSEGRCNWDSYYGFGNVYHLGEIKRSQTYKQFVRRWKPRQHPRGPMFVEDGK